MNEINSVNSEILSSLSLQNQPQTKSNDLGEDAFLQLMIAQLQNQDPLSPAKNEDFIAQLAQFSSVEGINNINTSISELSTTFKSNAALEASALVGRQVQVGTDVATLSQGSDVRGTIALPGTANNVQLIIENSKNERIQTRNLGVQSAGEVDFTWDGTNDSGEAVPEGQYKVTAVGMLGDQSTELPVFVGANVNSVTVGANNTMILNLEGLGSVRLDQVSRFL